MLKRTNKLTALLVAATAVASLAPAGVNAAEIKRIAAEEGTIYNAIAYKDGKFYIDGELEDKDEAAYYLADGKYNDLEDVDSGDTVGIFGTKYVEVSGGDYYIDLESGKVTDDEIAEDEIDDAASALRKKLKKDEPKDRYDSNDFNDLKKKNEISLIGNKFSENWFEVTVDAKTGQKANGEATSFTVYTDKDGKYIDADYNLGKVNVVTTGKSVAVDNTSDEEEVGSIKVSASIVQTAVIGSDKDYIYRTAKLTITSDKAADISFGSTRNPIDPNGDNVTRDGKTSVTVDVIQKISKAQASDDIDDAKYAKTVNTYFITDDEGNSEDVFSNYSVVNGKLINYKYENGKMYAQTIALKSKNGYNYTDVSDVADTKLENEDAYQIDVNGNLWTLEGGYIKKFDNDEDFDKVYKVDGAMTQLSVYDANNIVVWDEEDEVYSIIGSKSTDEEEVVEDDKVEVVAGWVQAADGTWSYNNADGTKATGWLNLNGTWYYLNAQGTMQTGWANVNGTWYYLAGSGAMQTGWVNDNGTWYYMQASGAMATGWLNDNGTWYYLNANGSMAANTTVDGYVLGANGAWVR